MADPRDWNRDPNWERDRDREHRSTSERSWENQGEQDWRTSRHGNEGAFRERTRDFWGSSERGVPVRDFDRGDREPDYDRRRSLDQDAEWQRRSFESARHYERPEHSWEDRSREGQWSSRRTGDRDVSYERAERAYPQTVGDQAYGGTGVGGGMMAAAGRFAGRGPKNYNRSDDRIREDVNEALTRDPNVDASDMEVSVTNGEVMISGSVDDRQQKLQAEECVWRVSGVREVQNQVRVRHGIGGMIASVFSGDETKR